MEKRYRFEIAPSEEQKQFLDKSFGCARLVWNTVLDRTQQQYEAHRANRELPNPRIGNKALTYHVKPLKEEKPFLKEVSSIILQQKLIDLEKSYARFFQGLKNSGPPRFKSKHSQQSLRLTSNGFSLKEKVLRIAKCSDPVKVFWSRDLPSQPSSVTIIKTITGRYFASFVCRYQPNRQHGRGFVGIDLGLKTLAVTSHGEMIDNPKYFRQWQVKLAKAQRRLCRKQKGSANRRKAKHKVAQLHEKIANSRKDYLHKVSHQMISENQVIILEDLNVRGMLKNRSLSKSVADSGFGMLRAMLTYKTRESGGLLVMADRFFPSTQLCSVCGTQPEQKLTLKQRRYDCACCGNDLDRDLNAAINLRNLGEYIINQYGIDLAASEPAAEAEGVLLRAPCRKDWSLRLQRAGLYPGALVSA